jgi:hypothetical protein
MALLATYNSRAIWLLRAHKSLIPRDLETLGAQSNIVGFDTPLLATHKICRPSSAGAMQEPRGCSLT